MLLESLVDDNALVLAAVAWDAVPVGCEPSNWEMSNMELALLKIDDMLIVSSFVVFGQLRLTFAITLDRFSPNL